MLRWEANSAADTMDGQLEAIRQDILSAKTEVGVIKRNIQQDLAAAKETKNIKSEKLLSDMLLRLDNQLLHLNNQLLSVPHKESTLLHGQAPSKPCLQLVCAGDCIAALVCTRSGSVTADSLWVSSKRLLCRPYD